MSYTYLLHLKAYRSEGPVDATVDMTWPEPLTRVETIRSAEHQLCAENGWHKCLLVSFTLLQGPEPAAPKPTPAPEPRYCPELQRQGMVYNADLVTYAERIRTSGGDQRSMQAAIDGIAALADFLKAGLIPEAAASYVQMLAGALKQVGLIAPGEQR